MKGIFINCPNKDCKKMFLKSAVLRVGTAFIGRCFHCGEQISLKVLPGNIELRLINAPVDIPVDNSEIDDDDDDGVIFL